MVEEADDLMGIKRPRRLNFNAPILSTRKRVSDFSDENSPDNCQQPSRLSYDTSESRVPFSWEQVPGTPKGITTTFRRSCCTPHKPPPRPPCCSPNNQIDDDNDDKCYFDIISDRLDVFSLSESLEAATTENNACRLNRLDLEILEASRNQSPSFIIKRFLPDATALAYSHYSLPDATALAYSHSSGTIITSSKNLQKNNGLPAPKHSETVDCSIPPFVGRIYSPPKACWLQRFFPWRKKLTPCGLKSPVRIVRGSSASRKYNAHSK